AVGAGAPADGCCASNANMKPPAASKPTRQQKIEPLRGLNIQMPNAVLLPGNDTRRRATLNIRFAWGSLTRSCISGLFEETCGRAQEGARLARPPAPPRRSSSGLAAVTACAEQVANAQKR